MMKQIQIQVELGNVHKSVDICLKKYKKKDGSYSIIIFL